MAKAVIRPPKDSLFAEEEKANFNLEIESQIKHHEKTIDYYVTDYTIELLVNKLENGELFIPHYQRKNIWELNRKSKFIESVLIGLPIPFLFFWQDPESGNLEVVDGAQRLTTLKEFLRNELKIGELEKLNYLTGLYYKDLLESRQKIFKNKPIRGVILSSKTDKASRLDLFERLNTGSKIAVPAEIRRGLLQGPFYSLVEELSEDVTFNQLTQISKKMQDQGEREEFITRFFAYGEDLENYNTEVRKFVFDYTDKMNERYSENPEIGEQQKEQFHTIMAFFNRNYPIGFKKDGKGQSSRTRFEGMAISLFLLLKEQPQILEQITPNDCKEVFDGQEFIRITGSDGANATKKLHARLNFAKDKFVEKYSNGLN